MVMNRHERRSAAKNLRSKGLGAEAGSLDQVVAMGIAAANSGDMSKAEAQFRQALNLDPGHVEAKHQLGTILARTGRGDEGIALLKEVTAAQPNEALYWSNLAAACYNVYDTAGAVDAARRSVALQPDYGLAWDNLGSALMDQESYEEAIGALARALELGAADLSSRKRLASCYMLTGDLDNAERHFRLLADSDPNDVDVMASLGAVLIDKNDFAAARSVLANAVAKAPDNFPAAYHFGRTLQALGETPEALRWLRRATSSEPRNPVGWRDLAEALFTAGDRENAIVAIDRAFSLAPNIASVIDLSTRIKGVAPGVPEAVDIPTVQIGTNAPGTPAKAAESGVVDLTILKIGA